MPQPAVVRLSRGTVPPEKADEVRTKLEEGRSSLEPALRQLRGLVHYYVAMDEQAGTLVNVSVWSGLAEAKQMDTLPPMLAQRAVFEKIGVRSTRYATIRRSGRSRPDARNERLSTYCLLR